MALKLTIASVNDSDSAEAIKKAIATVDPNVTVDVDVESNTVTVNSPDSGTPVASEESIKQAITALGHQVQ